MREERRKSRRFPVLGEQQQATLRVGDVSVPARLVDQSATGFAVRVEEHPGVFPGELVWLQTQSGWTEVRVVKARHEVDGTQIGLERIADLATGSQNDRGRFQGDQLLSEEPGGNPWPLVALGVALAALLGFLVWTAFARNMMEGASWVFPGLAGPADPRPAAVRAIQNEAQRRATDLHKSMQHLGGTMLILPEVVEHLRITPRQQRQLQEIMKSAAEAEAQLRRSAAVKGIELEERADLLRRASSDQALQVLDEEQRSQWHDMVEAALQRLRPQG